MDRKTIIFVILMTATFYLVNHFVFPPKPAPEGVATTTFLFAPSPAAVPQNDEHFYVIENDYQQLVVSSLNGALAEINLPLQSSDNPKSVVKKIWVDETLQKEYSQDDYFPAGPYQTYQGSFNKGELGSYYPLLRRDVAPAYYGLATATTHPETADTTYRLERLEKNLIEMEGTTAGVRTRKIY